jgi:hypothetical protein
MGLGGKWIWLHNEKLYGLCSSPNLFRVIKSRRMGWAGHVACTGDERGAYMVLVGRNEGKSHLEVLGVDRRTIIKYIFGKWDGESWTGLLWLGTGTGGVR